MGDTTFRLGGEFFSLGLPSYTSWFSRPQAGLIEGHSFGITSIIL